jgi:phytoene dehydrogenase-like protein
VVGAGHNGSPARPISPDAGQRVLVIESRARVGGACTIEEPFPGVRMSPCAYLAGLLHPLVVEELDLPRRGFTWTPAVNGLFVPFLDGSSIQLWDDDERCAAEVRALAPGDVEGWRAMSDVIRRLRDALRPARQPQRRSRMGKRSMARRAAHSRTN